MKVMDNGQSTHAQNNAITTPTSKPSIVLAVFKTGNWNNISKSQVSSLSTTTEAKNIKRNAVTLEMTSATGAAIVLGLHYAVVDLILMDASFYEIDGEAGELLHELRSKHILYPKQIFGSVL